MLNTLTLLSFDYLCDSHLLPDFSGPISAEERAFEAQVSANRDAQDKILEEISRGLSDLKELACESNKSLVIQEAMLAQVDEEVDSTSKRKKSVAPAKMKNKKESAESRPGSAMMKKDSKPSQPTAKSASSAVTKPTTTTSTSSTKPAEPAKPKSSEEKSHDADPDTTLDDTADSVEDSTAAGPLPVDWTALPVALDHSLSLLDPDSALRPTLLSAGATWSLRSQPHLLSPPTSTELGEPQQSDALKHAFDLLDALSRSGSLPIDCAELHIILAATHSFDRCLVDTVIQRNVNPIEKVERSALILATAVQAAGAEAEAAAGGGGPAVEPSLLIKPDQRDRIKLYSPQLFAHEAQPLAIEGGSVGSPAVED